MKKVILRAVLWGTKSCASLLGQEEMLYQRDTVQEFTITNTHVY